MRIAVKNLPESTKEDELRAYFSNKGRITDVFMLRNRQGMFRRVAFVGFQTSDEARDAMEYYNGAMFKNHKIAIEEAKEEEVESVQRSESVERRILYTKTIFIKNLSAGCDESALSAELSKLGQVMELKLLEKEGKWYAIVRFRDGACALEAFRSMRTLLGMRVRVSAFNESSAERQKQYYNTLFFNFDTIVKRTCEAERINPRDLINLKDTELGARVALLEAGLVEQTTAFLRHNGISLDHLTDKKSSTDLVVRNTDIMGMLDLIQGEYTISVAPSKSLALLRFEDAKDASATLKALNMRRHKNSIVYCEYAPICALPDTDNKPAEKAPANSEAKKKESKSNKVIVKNVPFQATVADLRSIFSAFTHVVDVRLPLKNEKQHRGFGFIVLDSPKNVTKAIEYFGKSTHLFGRRLVLEVAKA